MATVPKAYVREGRTWLKYFQSTDCHQWIIALEHGSHGLIHWQLRWKQRNLETKEAKENFFNRFKTMFPQAHIEFTENWCDYERKEGFFITSEDTPEILAVRFGTPRKFQREILHMASTQTDRQIDVWYDPQGNHGKSWLTVHCWEKGIAFPVFVTNARQVSADICSGYRGQRYIIIDIPRACKIPPEFYETVERIKDGLVHDSRYTDRTRNVRGTRLIVFTNQKLDVKRLSVDRWRLHGMKGEPLP